MRTFNDLASLARHLDRVRGRLPGAIEAELEAQGLAMQDEARAMFGRYQASWPELAPRTVAERVRQGYSPNDPLFREGLLRDAVTFQLEDGPRGRQVFVGVPDGLMLRHPYRNEAIAASKLMHVQEFGSDDGRVPARPVFGVIEHDMTRFVTAFGDGVIARIGL